MITQFLKLFAKSFILLIVYIAVYFPVSAQVQTLEIIGQTPGGSAFHVNYDANNQNLYAGVGTSIWVYDAADPTDLKLLAKRGLRGLPQATWRINNTLFVAAARDGLWALDLNTNTLDVIAHYPLDEPHGAYDLCFDDGVFYLANNRKVVVLNFDHQNGFTEHTEFGVNNAVSVAKRGDYIAVGSRRPLFNSGQVNIYHVDNLNTPIATCSSPMLLYIYKLQFADLRDDIIYVSAGSAIGGLTGRFVALHFDNGTLDIVDEFTMQGVAGMAQCNIINMVSRNDTIFLATTACLEYVPMPETSIPVLDASQLPDSSLKYIGHIQPGLWHFDVALIGDDMSHLAIASEWFGIWVSGVADLSNPYDTVGIFPTGGWGKRSYVFGDTLWACMEGYGLAAYKIDSLLHQNGFVENPEIFHVFEQFVNDFTFVDDTLIFLSKWNNKYEVYNIATWLNGGEPEHIGHFSGTGSFFAQSIASVETNVGTRVLCGHSTGNIEIIDPYDIPNWNGISMKNVGIDLRKLIVCNDTVWTGAKINNNNAIAAYKVESDSLRYLFSAHTPSESKYIAKDGNLLAAACGYQGIALYYYDQDGIYHIKTISGNVNAIDCELKNNYLYVADRLKGVLVYDINDPMNEIFVAECMGSGGYYGQFGSQTIQVANDGRIYLADYNGGIYIIEPYDTSVSIFENDNKTRYEVIQVFPNPTNDKINITTSINEYEIVLLNIFGQVLLKEKNKKEINVSLLKPGTYILRINGGNFSEQKKIIVY